MKYSQRILGYVRPYRRLVGGAMFVVVLAVAFGLLAPLPMKIILDYVVGDHPPAPWLHKVFGPLAAGKRSLLLATVILMVLVVLIENLLSVAKDYLMTKLDQKMVLDFRADLFQHAQRLSLAFHDQKRSGPLIYAINFQANAAAGVVLAAPPLFESMLMLIGMLVVSFMISWKLALLSLAVLPPLYYSVGYYASHIEGKLRQVKQMEQVSLSIIHEAINMLRVIVAFGREGHELKRFREQGRRAGDARVGVTVRQTLFSLAVKTITGIGIAAVVGVGAHEVLAGRLLLGNLWLIIAYIGMIYRPLEAISFTLGSLQDNLMNLKMAAELLDLEPEITDKPGAIELPARAAGKIEFRDVRFSYSGRSDTLSDISFTAQPGQVVAVVGPTGAGKTTLVSLMPRFYAPSGGQILLDDREISGITLRSLREQISMVPQEPLLFSGTVADNIRYGNLDATTEQVIEAARNANAHDFIERLPNGYDTEIGEHGARLSGGERQRLCVARAFLKNAPILILDEPTSAIDSRTEAVILDALDLLMQGRTTFMIAHRLSTVRRADLILVLDRGRLVEQGTHDQLLERDGLYKHLHDIQLGTRRRTRLPATTTGEAV